MTAFKKILLVGFFISLTISKGFANNNPENYSEVNIFFLNSFNKGNFDSSLQNLFQQLIDYKKTSDSLNLYRTWSRISAVYFIQGRIFHCRLALDSVKNFDKFKSENYFWLNKALSSLGSDSKSVDYYLGKIKSRDDNFIDKCKLCIVLQSVINKKGSKSSIITNLLETQISKMVCNRDTLWFGYAKYNFYLGVSYYDCRLFSRSLTYILKAQLLFEQLTLFSKEWIETYYYIFNCTFYLKDEKLGNKYIGKFIEHYENKHINSSNLFYYYNYKGNYFYICNKYKESIDANKEAIKYSKNNSYESGVAMFRLISSYYSLGDFKRVIEWSKKYNGDKNNSYYTQLASSYYMLGEYSLSDLYFKKAVVSFEGVDTAAYYSNIIGYYYRTLNYREVGKYLNKYIQYTIDIYGKNSIKLAIAYERLAYKLWIYDNDIQLALGYYMKILNILTRQELNNNLNLLNLEKSIDDEFLARVLRNIAEAHYVLSFGKKKESEKQKNLQEALLYYEYALKAVTHHKSALQREDQKLFYTDLVKHYYSFIMQVCLELYKNTSNEYYAKKAFEYTEKGKASMLLSMTRGNGARKLGTIPVGLKNKEELIIANTNKYYKLVISESNKNTPDTRKIDYYNTELNKLRSEQDSLKYVFKSKYSSYYRACFENDVVGCDSLKKLLKPNQVALQYSLTDNYLLIFLITKDKFIVYKDSSGKQLFNDIAWYRKRLTNFDLTDTRTLNVVNFEDVANRLYKRLLSPFERYLKDNELVIFPDDVLNTIPFESFVTSKVSNLEKYSYRKLHYLINKNALSYNYSASLYAQTHKIENDLVVPRLIAIAPYGKGIPISDIKEGKNSGFERDSVVYSPIPGSEEEVKAIDKIYNEVTFFKKQVTESRFKQVAGSYNIIHIASHGIVDNENPLFSKILLKPQKDSTEDGLLNTYEVYSLHLNTPLVVLSACNTGYGKLYKGEGIMSMARGFIVAGAQDVVMTLWSVADKTSNELMKGFYNYLSQSNTVNVALQNAKNDYLSNADNIKSHPYFWAGYVSVGNSDMKFANPNRKSFSWMIFVSAVLLLSGIIIFYRNRLKLWK